MRWSMHRGLALFLAGAATPAVATPAASEDRGGAAPWELRIEGAFLWRQQRHAPVAAERVAIFVPAATGTERIGARDNWSGRAELRRRLDGEFDVGLAFQGIVGPERSRPLHSAIPEALILPGLLQPGQQAAGGLDLDARTRATHLVADLDLGFGWSAGADGAAKFTAGLRFAHFRQETRLALPGALFPVPGTVDHRRNDRFVGGGPRLGLRYAHRLNPDFALQAGVAVAALFGEQTLRSSTNGGGLSGAFDAAHGRVVFNGDIEAGLAYRIAEGVSISLGYQAAAWIGLRDNRREVDAAATLAANPVPTTILGGGERRPIDLTHGPFVRIAVRW